MYRIKKWTDINQFELTKVFSCSDGSKIVALNNYLFVSYYQIPLKSII